MNANIRRKLSMARRALDFATSHPLTDDSFATVLARLTTSVAQADSFGVQEVDGRTQETAAHGQRAALRAKIRRTKLSRLVNVATVASRTSPELVGLFQMPSLHLTNKAFVLAAESLLATAQLHKDVLVPLGLGPTFFDDLTASLQDLDGATTTAHTGRSDHVGARASLSDIMRVSKTEIALLDSMYRGGDSSVLTAWESARNLPGPFTRTPDIAPVGDPPVIAPVPVQAPVSMSVEERAA